MNAMQVLHIPIIALINLGVIYLWNKKVRKRVFQTPKIWLYSFFGSLFNVWGLDVIQRNFVVENVPDMIKVSAGCWLVFVVATNAKYLVIYNWSKRDFWLDYGGDLVSYLLAGILIFVAT